MAWAGGARHGDETDSLLKREWAPHCGAHSTLNSVRRCPTLPHPGGCSTIGAVGLSFRVRDGTGRFPHAVAAVTLFPALPRARPGVGGGGGGSLVAAVRWCAVLYSVVLCSAVPWGLLSGDRRVDAGSMVLVCCWCV